MFEKVNMFRTDKKREMLKGLIQNDSNTMTNNPLSKIF